MIKSFLVIIGVVVFSLRSMGQDTIRVEDSCDLNKVEVNTTPLLKTLMSVEEKAINFNGLDLRSLEVHWYYRW